MFEEPVRFIEDVIRNDRSVLDLLYAQAHVRESVAGEALRNAGARRRRRQSGCASTMRGRYGRGGLLHDGGVPDPELARAANQPRQARLLGGSARARRDDPTSAALGAGTAEGRSRRWICRCARCWPSTARTRACAACHARFDAFGLAFERLRPGWRAARRRIWRTARGDRGRLPGRQPGRPASRACGSTSAQHRQNDFVDNLSRKLWLIRWAGRCSCPTTCCSSRCGRSCAAKRYRFSSLVEAIVTSPQFLNKRSPAGSADKADEQRSDAYEPPSQTCAMASPAAPSCAARG